MKKEVRRIRGWAVLTRIVLDPRILILFGVGVVLGLGAWIGVDLWIKRDA
jgi:serine acetyltransferase